jgi:phosphate-selective porin OprO/OprP
MAAVVDQTSTPTSTLGGAYAQVGYFLTGEHRPYDRNAGAIDRVIPHCDLKRGDGLGAWEIAARWSYVDLVDNEIDGGTMQNATAGLNWYANAYCKCVFNYIHSWGQTPDFFPIVSSRQISSQTDIFATRLQIDF